MAKSALLREIEALRAEFDENSRAANEPEEVDAAFAETHRLLDSQVGEIDRLVRSLLAESGDAVGEHPLASVAGALALGILIGRLTA